MQNTSALYNQIVASQNHWFEAQLLIPVADAHTERIEYLSQRSIFSISINHSAFSDGVPQIGCAISGEVDATFIDPSIPRAGIYVPKMAKIQLEIRAKNDSSASEWIPKGTFYIDTREVSRNDDDLDVMKIHAYDAMLMFEQMYPSDDSHDYPLLDTTLLQFMADSVGVVIDQRTLDIMNRGFMFSLPAGYTMREMLGYIASAYGGNFVISDEGKLLLVQLGGLREETYYLVDENGDSITFGGNRILV